MPFESSNNKTLPSYYVGHGSLYPKINEIGEAHTGQKDAVDLSNALFQYEIIKSDLFIIEKREIGCIALIVVI